MATSTVLTNKPINPRGDDNRPVDSYNRASLYSGKALDFDGVNDYVTVENITDTYKSFCFYFKPDADITAASSYERLFGIYEQYFGISTGAATGIVTGETLIFMPNGGGRFGTTMEFVANTWYHVAVVAKESDNTYLMYINGRDKTDLSAGTHIPSAAIKVRLAWDVQGNGTKFNGQIANFKAFSEVLTAAQVSDLYNNPEKIVPTGVSNTALKLWLPMMEGAGTTAINGAPDALGSELITNGDFSDGTNDWTFGSAFSVVNGKAYYNDSASGNQIYQSNLTFSESKNYILTFDISDATDAVIWVGNGAGSNAYTINANYHTYNNGHYSLFLRGSDIGASETTLGIWANPNGAAFSIDNISLKEVANCGTISGATWTHGVGSPVAQTSVIDWNKWKLEGGSTTNEYLIPQGLTAGRDLLGNLFENVRKQGALNLDGNSWAEVHDNASLDITDAITLEAWVYWDSSSDKGILGRYMTLTGERSYLLYKSNQNDFAIFVSSDGTSANSDFKINDTNISEGWNHLVGVYDGSSLKVYLNGSIDGSKSTAIASLYANDEPIEIGRYAGALSQLYTNDIAQPRIYNRALTASEVLNNYNATKTQYQ